MTNDPLPLYRTRDHDRAGARALQRRHRAGSLVRVTDGVYADAAAWAARSASAQHLTVARALAPGLRPGAAFSHATAAMAYGWPMIGMVGARVHVTDGATRRTEHRAHLVRHAGPPETGNELWTFSRVPLTSRVRTAVDLAATLEPSVAAVAIDAAVRGGTLLAEDFVAALPERPARGSVRGRAIAEALDPAHESVGESYAAIRMVELGLPRPVAQHPLCLPDGSSARVDFWFPDLGLVVEFDGKQKYTDREMLAGRRAEDAVWHEKLREDRLRALPEVRSVVRPTWWHLAELNRLHSLFQQHRVVV